MVFETAAVWTAISPFVAKYLAAKAGKLVDTGAKSVWSGFQADERAAKANKAFIERFRKELDSADDFTTLNSEPYRDALIALLQNETGNRASSGGR